MATTDATPVPVKNQAYRLTFPILDADGDLVTAAGSLDSEVSKDAGTFVDCTNEATEIPTSSGIYYLDLTATEMNADTVAIIVKSTGGKTTPIILYPQADGNDLDVNVTHIAGSAVSTSTAQLGVNVVNAAGTAWGSGAITAASIASSAITDAKLATGAFTAAKFAASSLDGKGDWNTDTTATIVDAVWDEDLVTGHAVANSAAVHAKDTLADTNELQGDWADAGRLDAILDSRMAEASITTSGGAVTTVTTATNVTTVNGLAANTVTASALATDAVDEIVDAVWDEDLVTGHAVANSAAVHAKDILTDTNELQGDWTNTGRLDTIIDDILGRLPSTLVSGRIDASVGSMATDVVTASALATSAVDEIRDGLLPTQSAAFTFNFLFVAASDHVTPVTGATGTAVTRSIDGAAFSTGGGTITEIANGIYEYAASAGDMGGGVVTFRFVGTGGTPGAPDDCFVTIATGGAV